MSKEYYRLQIDALPEVFEDLDVIVEKMGCRTRSELIRIILAEYVKDWQAENGSTKKRVTKATTGSARKARRSA